MKYETPEMELLEFKEQDVVRTSLVVGPEDSQGW